jgi:hypothetical protein
MTVLLASAHAAPDLALAVDVRALVRRALGPMLLGGVVVGAVLLFCAHGFIDGLRRALAVRPSWAALAAGFECVSLAGYVGRALTCSSDAASRAGLGLLIPPAPATHDPLDHAGGVEVHEVGRRVGV